VRLTFGHIHAQPQRIDANDIDERRAGGQVFSGAGFLLLHDAIQGRVNRRVGQLLFSHREFGATLGQQSLPIANFFQTVLVTAQRNFVFGLGRVEFRARDHALFDQLGRAIASRLCVLQNGFRLSHGSGFFGTDAIVCAIRRETKSRSRLGQPGFSLLHTQFVLLWFKLRDDLTFTNHAAEIDRDSLEPARNFRAHSEVIISCEVAVYGHRFTDGRLGDFDRFDLARGTFAVRARGLA
jgi:hypothetical protein